MDFLAILHPLFLTNTNPNAVRGDAVYYQEALDHIIMSPMEANPQSNAAPPASNETISKLPRRKLDEKMLGREIKGKCTVCIDDVGLGDEVIMLPCKHWFHDGCVVLWLREHNTCPLCRTSVEGERGSQSRKNEAASGLEAGLFSTRRHRSNLHQILGDLLESLIDSARAAGGSSDEGRSSQRQSDNFPTIDPPLPQTSRVSGPSPSSRRLTSRPLRPPFTDRDSSSPLHWLRRTFGRNNRS